jgi:hypothetical protein
MHLSRRPACVTALVSQYVVGSLSPQLENLLTASLVSNPKPCAKYQFLGEFMHAYADTFSVMPARPQHLPHQFQPRFLRS